MKSMEPPRTVRHKIALKSGVHLGRDFVSDTMRAHQPDGFLHRDPGAKRIHREKKVPIGINERWSGDGHDKLYSIGFPIWAIVDDGTGKWLDADVVPSNRLGHIVAYLFLRTVEKIGGMLIISKLAKNRVTCHHCHLRACSQTEF